MHPDHDLKRQMQARDATTNDNHKEMHNSKINDFQTQLNSYDFVSKTTNPTPYELVLMDFSKSRPNPNLITRNKINSNSIPNYQASIHVLGGGGGDSGILAGVGGAVIIAIKVSFLF